MPDTSEFRRARLIYTGVRADGKERQATYLAEGDGSTRRFKVSKSIRRFMMGSIGTIYEVDETPDGASTMVGGSTKVVGYVQDATLLAGWRAAHQQAEGQLTLRAETDPLRRALQPLRRAYFAAPAPRRAQLIAWVVQEIVKGSYSSMEDE